MRLLPALICMLILLASPAVANEPPVRAASALADKSDRIVVFYDEGNNEIARFHAVFGQMMGPKQHRGDGKTPEGDYIMNPPRPSDSWGWFMPINYPNTNDLARARAQRLPADELGGQIGLHAAGDGFLHNVRQSFGENWTEGCIAVSDSAMDAIRTFVTTPVMIRIQP
jgi:murein L,D-transpeptidase YafK